MNLQSRILREYRELHPRHTLRETSKLTGIQLTRVFRLFNGHAMKLEEYERFHRAVHNVSDPGARAGGFRRATEEMARNFGPRELERVTAQLERQLSWHRCLHGSDSLNQDTAHTA